jgi:HK97 family phage portal protein
MKLPFLNVELTNPFKRANSMDDMYKKAMAAAGIQYAMIQNNQVYTIGNNPTSYIKEGYKQNAVVYSAVEAVAKSAKRVHYKLFEVSNRNEKIEIDDHDILDLLHRPSPLYSKGTFTEQQVIYWLLTGEVFLVKVKPDIGDNKNVPTQLVSYSPQYIKVMQNPDTGLPQTYLFDNNKKKILIDADDMIYWRKLDPEGGVRGMSPLMAARKVIVHSNNGYEANMKLTQNMGPSGILSYPSDYDETQLDQLQKKYQDKYAGSKNYGKMMFTTAGADLKWIPTGFKAEDLQLVEGQRMSMRDICNIYGFSSQILNDPENKTYNNMNDARKSLILNAVLPVLKEFIDVLNSQLIPDFEKRDGKKYELEVDKQSWEEIKEDLLVQAQTAAICWWLTTNEKRMMMGYEALDIPEGNDLYVPANFLPLSTETDSESTLRNAHLVATQIGLPKPVDPNAAEPKENPNVPDDASDVSLNATCMTLNVYQKSLLKALGADETKQRVTILTKDGKSLSAWAIKGGYLNLENIVAEDIAFINVTND